MIYADSSAVLAWILDQDRATEVGGILAGASEITCSALTVFECDRVLRRGAAGGTLSREEAERFEEALRQAARTWAVKEITPEVLAAARRTFPREPMRALDAIHLGTALHLRREFPDLVFLALDRRLADNAALLGFEVLPPRPPDR